MRPALPITPDPRLIRVVGNYGEDLPGGTLAAQVETALKHRIPFRVVRAHSEERHVGLLRRRTVTVIDEVEFEAALDVENADLRRQLECEHAVALELIAERDRAVAALELLSQLSLLAEQG